MLDRDVEELLGGAHRARPEAEAAIVEHLHGDLEALAGLAEHVLGRDPDVLVIEMAKIVAAQAHRVVALADLKPLHVGSEDQRDVTVLAVHLRAGEGHKDVGAAAVSDVALLAVEAPRAIGLAHGAGLEVVGVRARVVLGERERGELAPRGEVRQEAGLLLLGPEEHDALHPDRLVDAHDHRERAVDLGELLGDAAVAGLAEPGAAVLLRHVQPQQPALAELADLVVADPAALLHGALVVVLAELAHRGHALADALALLIARGRIGEDQLLVDLAEEQRLGERRDALLPRRRLLGGRRLHPRVRPRSESAEPGPRTRRSGGSAGPRASARVCARTSRRPARR